MQNLHLRPKPSNTSKPDNISCIRGIKAEYIDWQFRFIWTLSVDIHIFKSEWPWTDSDSWRVCYVDLQLHMRHGFSHYPNISLPTTTVQDPWLQRFSGLEDVRQSICVNKKASFLCGDFMCFYHLCVSDTPYIFFTFFFFLLFLYFFLFSYMTYNSLLTTY